MSLDLNARDKIDVFYLVEDINKKPTKQVIVKEVFQRKSVAMDGTEYDNISLISSAELENYNALIDERNALIEKLEQNKISIIELHRRIKRKRAQTHQRFGEL